MQICDDHRSLQLFSFALNASSDGQPKAVHAYNDNGRRLSSQDCASIACIQCVNNVGDSNFSVFVLQYCTRNLAQHTLDKCVIM